MSIEPLETVVTTARLRLRVPHADDAAFLLQLLNDPDWLRFIGDRNVRTLEAARAYADRLQASHESHGFGLWLVERLDTGARLGLMGFVKRDWLAHPDIGFAFMPEARGHGFAREAAAAVLELARGRLAMHDLLAILTPENLASRRLLESVGMAYSEEIVEPDSGIRLALYTWRPGPAR